MVIKLLLFRCTLLLLTCAHIMQYLFQSYHNKFSKESLVWMSCCVRRLRWRCRCATSLLLLSLQNQFLKHSPFALCLFAIQFSIFIHIFVWFGLVAVRAQAPLDKCNMASVNVCAAYAYAYALKFHLSRDERNSCFALLPAMISTRRSAGRGRQAKVEIYLATRWAFHAVFWHIFSSFYPLTQTQWDLYGRHWWLRTIWCHATTAGKSTARKIKTKYRLKLVWAGFVSLFRKATGYDT